MSREERMQILKMVETGKISADDGMKLLEAVEADDQAESGSAHPAHLKRNKKAIRVQVFEGDLEKPKVNINVPVGLVKIITKFIPESAKAEMTVNDKPFDIDEIVEMVEMGTEGVLMEVDEPEKKERVIISVG